MLCEEAFDVETKIDFTVVLSLAQNLPNQKPRSLQKANRTLQLHFLGGCFKVPGTNYN